MLHDELVLLNSALAVLNLTLDSEKYAPAIINLKQVQDDFELNKDIDEVAKINIIKRRMILFNYSKNKTITDEYYINLLQKERNNNDTME